MRRCASRIATRRISWMDHGTCELGDVSTGAEVWFFRTSCGEVGRPA